MPLDDQLSLSASETEEAFTQEINESNPPIAIDNEDDKIEDSDVISSPMFPPKEFHIAGIEGSSVETLLSSNNQYLYHAYYLISFPTFDEILAIETLGSIGYMFIGKD